MLCASGILLNVLNRPQNRIKPFNSNAAIPKATKPNGAQYLSVAPTVLVSSWERVCNLFWKDRPVCGLLTRKGNKYLINQRWAINTQTILRMEREGYLSVLASCTFLSLHGNLNTSGFPLFFFPFGPWVALISHSSNWHINSKFFRFLSSLGSQLNLHMKCV